MDHLASLTELLHELDGTTYFFVSSGLFLGITALIFFILGVWMGRMIWRRHKGHRRSAETSLEFLKNENAQLKVRIADLTARLAAGAAPLPGPRSDAGLQTYLPPQEMASPGPLETTAVSTTTLPLARCFTLWTLPVQDSVLLCVPSRAFTVWTEPHPLRAARIADFLPVVSHTLSAGAGWSPPTPHPVSRAFAIWTETGWRPRPPVPSQMLLPPGKPFTLWTVAESGPAAPTLPQYARSRAFTLWTAEPAPPAAPMVTASSAADRVAAAALAVRAIAMPPPSSPVTAPGHLPPSQAFTLWTTNEGLHVSSGITQRTALAALIRSRVEEPTPTAPATPSMPDSPPPAPARAAATIPAATPFAAAPSQPTPSPKPAPRPLPERSLEEDTKPVPVTMPPRVTQAPPPAVTPPANPVSIEPLPFVHLDE